LMSAARRNCPGVRSAIEFIVAAITALFERIVNAGKSIPGIASH
jgi:hypothetical protein